MYANWFSKLFFSSGQNRLLGKEEKRLKEEEKRFQEAEIKRNKVRDKMHFLKSPHFLKFYDSFFSYSCLIYNIETF